MTLFEIRVYENSWRERAICCVVPAKAGTHNHRCMLLRSVWLQSFTKLKLVVMGPRFRGGDEMRLNARPCPTAIASESFKPAKIYSVKPRPQPPVARRNNDADGSLNRTGVVAPSPAEVRRSLNPS